MRIHFLRHAAMVVTLGAVRVLVDPMLSPMSVMDPVANAADQRRIPLIELPIDANALVCLIHQVDGVLVTHTHRDHWDQRARELIPMIAVPCQPEDEGVISEAGFAQVVPIETVNHCLLTRAVLAEWLETEGVRAQVTIPADGEEINLSA